MATLTSTTTATELQAIPSATTTIPADLESPTLALDPFQLSQKIKTPGDISSIRNELRQRSQHQTALRSSFRSGLFAFKKSPTAGQDVGPHTPGSAQGLHGSISPLSRIPDKYRNRPVDVRGVEKFYEEQNELIEKLLKSVDDHREEAKQEKGSTRLKYLIAVQGSLIANIILSALQVYAAVSSGSLSLFASKLLICPRNLV